MKKFYLILAAAAGMTFASCTNTDYIGDVANTTTTPTLGNGDGSIVFGGNAGRITRATSNTGTVAQMLDGQMKVYGVKVTDPSGTPAYSDVFTNYVVWSATDKTTSNPDQDWEYVGASGLSYGHTTTAGTLPANQYIKYWDYSTDEYHFVAGSPVTAFTYNLTSGEIASATVAGIAGHLNPNTSGEGITTEPIYIADPVKVEKTNYQQEVTFSFTRQQSFVRVGVFETIPGYSIEEIHFYNYGTSAWGAVRADQNICLASATENYFRGATNGTATLTYANWATTPSYTFVYSTSGLTQQQNWYGGALNGVPATTSTESTIANLYGTDDDMNGTTGYFTVIPMASAAEAQPILIKCDYVLKALDGAETINVTGATAAIPAAYCKWKPNTSYTYLFKISDNTNGTTGTIGTDPEGLFPITFDAVVVAEVDGTQQGTITTVTTPSITTYQEGSVTATGIKYTTGQPIYFTAQNDETGELNSLIESAGVGFVKVYSLGSTPKTEADLQLTPPTTGDVTTFVVSSEKTYGNVTLPAGKHAKFTPSATGYYAIRYQTAASPATYAYKVVKVED